MTSSELQLSIYTALGLNSPAWSILHHLGGNGPWIQKIDGVITGSYDVPEGCKVEQVHMVWPRYIEVVDCRPVLNKAGD